MERTKTTPQIAMIGFGEAARAFAKGWGAGCGGAVTCFDLKLEDPALAGAMQAAAQALGVAAQATRGASLAGVQVVFSLVTADQAVQAARQCAPHLRPGVLWLDCNSCAPDSKREAAEVIAAAGGFYVDVAVMAPVHPRLHRTPLLIAGPGAEAAEPILAALGMTARRIEGPAGAASSIKMIRSVMVKGLEALTAECFLAAFQAGVQAEVLGSLIASNPEMDWPNRAAYNLERMMEHGQRRAAEMREVVRTLEGLGLPSALTAAVAAWHDRIGAMGLKAVEGDLDTRAALLLERL